MSSVRVLVGTRKGAFILTSDGKRKKWDVSGPHFRRLGDVSPQGLAGRSEPDLRLADQRLVRADHSALRRRRQDVGPAGHAGRRADHDARRHAQGREQQVRLRHRRQQAAHDAPVVRRHAASLGVQARLASGAVADRSRHRLCRRGGRRPLPLDRRRQDLAGAGRPARAARGKWAPGAGGMGLHTILLDPKQSAAASTSPSRPRARSAPTTAARPGSRSTRGSSRSTCPIPTPRSASASIASPCTRRGRTCCSCSCTGT